MGEAGAGLDRIHTAGGCLARVVYVGLACLYLLAVLLTGLDNGFELCMILVALVVTAGAMTVRHLTGWAVAVAAVSGLITLFIALASPEFQGMSVVVEIGGLLVLIARVVWKTPRERLVPVAVALTATLMALPFRASTIAAVLFTAPLGVLAAVAIGVGLYLRAVDARRSRTLAAARRDERLELARDLHDFVAHHVTGIVVQAQAARFAAQSGAGQSPEQLDTMFGGIEKAGTEALTSMRRMVGLLRDAQDAGAADGDAGRTPGGQGPDGDGAPRPVGGLARVEEVVAAFSHPPATLSLSPGLGDLPPEVTTSVHRVVQESLTNARKHAADSTAVHVSVTRLADGSVEVAVRDDGQGRSRRLPSSGFGLAGLRERIDAVGGLLRAGPRPEGGWEVVAVLPVRDP